MTRPIEPCAVDRAMVARACRCCACSGSCFDLLLYPLRALRRGQDGARGDLRDAHDRRRRHGRDRQASLLGASARRRRSRSTTYAQIVDHAIADARVRGIVSRSSRSPAGWPPSVSLRDQLARARAAGKEVVVHLPLGGGPRRSSSRPRAARCFLGPAAQLAALGFASRTRYVKSALDKAGIVPEVYACGEYKSAGESLVRDSMSDAQREQLGKLLDRFDGALLDAIAEGRSVSRERARAIVDGGPYFGEAGHRGRARRRRRLRGRDPRAARPTAQRQARPA